jgi:UDP-2,3-diacylglucosamine pyrophosphatase LpxH
MQVFISDLHLTDGTSGETIKAGAFKLFADQLEKLVQDVNAKELKIVLLGDIFDVIRSTKWLNLDAKIRPWAPAGSKQEAAVQSIVTDILQQNRDSLGYLNDLRQFAAEKKILFELQYVIGNHDWLINRYDNIRKDVAAALGMIKPEDTAPDKFLTEIPNPEYKTFARHGDIYDKFNYMGNRDKSSIGDAIVIELLNRFPIEVGRLLDDLGGSLTAEEKKCIVDKLREIDNIRPLLDAPSWIVMVLRMMRKKLVRQVIEDAWKKCVDDFFTMIPFIKKMDIPFRLDVIDELQIGLQLSSHISKQKLDKLRLTKMSRFFPTWLDVNYSKKAWAERMIRSGEAKYVLYGHTHDHLIVPMDQVISSSGGIENKIYFNTGTWRQTWNKVVFDKVNIKFIGWKVLTYIAFYKADENRNYDFEVWNGALG